MACKSYVEPDRHVCIMSKLEVRRPRNRGVIAVWVKGKVVRVHAMKACRGLEV